MQLGIFGGTFDPIHIGHLRIAIEFYEQFKLDELRLVPCADPPHRDTPLTSARHRLNMVTAVIQGFDNFTADDCELQRNTYSYTVDTLAGFKAQFPKANLFTLIGMDSLHNLTRWHEWERLFDYTTIVVATRPEVAYPDLNTLSPVLAAHETNGKLQYLQAPGLDVSATQIRAKLQKSYSTKYILPDAVAQYIHTNGLYK